MLDVESDEQELGMLALQSIVTYLIISASEGLSLTWNAPIYAFYEPEVKVEWVLVKGQKRKCHTFKCALTRCWNARIRRFLDKGDIKSTGNLRKHAKVCWGEDTINNANMLANIEAARALMDGVTQSVLTAAFARVVTSKVTYSTRQHTKSQVR
jgi:hypothetical protein